MSQAKEFHTLHDPATGSSASLPMAIKHQIRNVMFEDMVKEAAVIARAEASRQSLSEEPRPAAQIT
jgi:hypothetical protein